MIVVAICMLGLILVPARAWIQPAIDNRYIGFDSNLVYSDAKGKGATTGVVTMSSTAVQLEALPFSDPTVELVTSPLSFNVSMRFRILETQGATTPLQMCLWNQVTQYRACLSLGPSPHNSVVMRTLAAAGTVITESILGNYSPGQLYSLTASLDRTGSRFSGVLSSNELPPFTGRMLLLDGGRNAPQRYGDLVSDPIPVRPGLAYDFGGSVRALSGNDSYKLNTFWLDKLKHPLGFSNDWLPVASLSGWTNLQFGGIAPRNAAFAQIHLAAGDATQALFGQLFFRAALSGPNLLTNSDFTNQSAGWKVQDQPQTPLDFISPSAERYQFSIGKDEVPPLFAYIRNYLELSAPSDGGTSKTTIQDYSLTLPSQRWFAAKIADERATVLTVFLSAVGLILCLVGLAIWIRRHRQRSARSLLNKRLHVRVWLICAGIVGFAYLIANALLFHLGAMPFDMISQQVWSYTGATYGMPEMYYRPFISTSLAPLWNGAPLNEPGYPYGITTAYLYTGIGWLNNLFLTGPGSTTATPFSLEFLIKSLNVLFAMADGALTFFILRGIGVKSREAAIGAGLFLLNPAVLFAMSIWGQNETIAIFFVLLSIYAAERGWPLCAWLAIAAAALTKPQVMLLTPLLAIIYLRRFPLKANVSAIASTVVISFLFLLPFALTIGPSLPVDVALKVLGVWGTAIDPSQNSVAGDSYSLWPLVTGIAAGQSHLARFSYPENVELYRGLSYNSVSNLLWGGLLGIIAVIILLFRRVDVALERYVPFLALALFGFMMFKTGMLSRYFIYCFPLLILTKRSMSNYIFYAMMAIVTVTTFVGIWGGFGVETAPTPWAAPIFHQANGGLTELVISLFSSDRFITFAVAANLLVLIFLAAAAGRALIANANRPPAQRFTTIDMAAAPSASSV